jgi:protein-S-isoprenylcysteine O-methyltransferase Ste14
MPAAFRAAIMLLIGVAIFAGLPLLGWGVDDLQGFISNPARLGYIVLVVLLQLFIVIKMPEVGQSRAGEKIVRRQRLAVVVIQVISIAMVIAAPYGDRRNIAVLTEGGNLRYIGLVMFSLGLIVTTWAEAKLGKLFSTEVTIQKGHKLVTGGLYQYLRHPRYLGMLVFSIGISLVFRSWLTLLLVTAMTLVLLWRIHDEEALMHEEFGSDWEAYSQRSWRLIPFVY